MKRTRFHRNIVLSTSLVLLSLLCGCTWKQKSLSTPDNNCNVSVLTGSMAEVGEIDWYWRYCQYYWQYSWNWILKITTKWSWVWNWILKSQHLAFDIDFQSWLVKFQCWVLNLDIVEHFLRYWTWIWYWDNNS